MVSGILYFYSINTISVKMFASEPVLYIKSYDFEFFGQETSLAWSFISFQVSGSKFGMGHVF
jgi:hypothetical protein